MEDIIKEVAQTLNIPQEHVQKIVSSFFKSFKKSVTKVTYRDLESFEGVKTNAVIPGFGKLIVSAKRKSKFKPTREIYKDGKEYKR